MKLLVTGAAGFVGRHLISALKSTFGPTTEIIPTSLFTVADTVLGQVVELDVTDANSVEELIRSVKPTHVINLAGIASVSVAATKPTVSWLVHVNGALNLARAIQEHVPHCVLVQIGSGEVYGATANLGSPLDERSLLAPLNDYAVTKAAADLALGALAVRGLRCIRLRPFNHTGVGQETAFVVPGFAMQIARIEAGLQEPVMSVGNLDVERDFVDVRDVVDAYVRVIRKSDELAGGTIINIASGTSRFIRDVLDCLLQKSNRHISVEQSPTLSRATDVPRLRVDISLARRLLDWTPRHPFDATLTDVLDDCRKQIGES
jgi:GDP-4-dehydro-6-deoxy-D-mannose reductase